MPPRRLSRHLFTAGIQAEDLTDERMFLTERERFFYRKLSDNRQHVVVDGDTLFNLAGRYYSPVKRACGLWWVVADFQPEPIHDPTLALVAGDLIFIPSLRTVLEEIFSESRRG